MERAKRDPDLRFRSLAHLIDEGALRRAYRSLRKGAAVGVDFLLESNGKPAADKMETSMLFAMQMKVTRAPIWTVVF